MTEVKLMPELLCRSCSLLAALEVLQLPVL